MGSKSFPGYVCPAAAVILHGPELDLVKILYMYGTRYVGKTEVLFLRHESMMLLRVTEVQHQGRLPTSLPWCYSKLMLCPLSGNTIQEMERLGDLGHSLFYLVTFFHIQLIDGYKVEKRDLLNLTMANLV